MAAGVRYSRSSKSSWEGPSCVPLVPAWVKEYAQPRFRHVVAGFDDVRHHDSTTFQRHVADAYEAIFEQLDSAGACHPVRFWAFVPGINDEFGPGLDRYMAFNAARFGVFRARFGRPSSFSRSLPTGSAVGVSGDTFLLHCLLAHEVGRPVENPRQISAYRYSPRFGPMPPCFARATLLGGEAYPPMLLVGGTASITGEESRHVGALSAQAAETFRNLASVVASAGDEVLSEGTSTGEIRHRLQAFTELRVYYRHAVDRVALECIVRAAFSPRCRVEWVQACICRPELLLEIEGVAFPEALAPAERLRADRSRSA